ncbi:MAG TPA: GGDEF domain-containing protein [Phycisphaerae bacterium]|nr:GGDEF domain-containing protein [Phycisphaerae bacterium]
MNATRHHGLRGELRDIFVRAKMPSSPALAARILELINVPTSSAADFGEIIRSDPALSTRLLKMANSAHFAQRTPATTIDRAVAILGLNRVRTIALGFQLVTHLNRLGGAPFDMKAFWQHSLLRACLARAIAQQIIPHRKEEAFLVGLLQDCGVLLLVQVLGPAYSALYRSNLSPIAFHEVERTSFPHDHVEAISALTSEWNFPEIIAVPISQHHQPVLLSAEPSDTERLSAVSYFVGGLRFVGDATVDRGERQLQQIGEATLRLDEAAWTRAQQSAGEEYRRISTLYGDLLPDDIDVADLLSEANRQLSCVLDDADQRLLDVKAERDAIHREQRRLAYALSAYRERAALDPLTNVLNRGALSEAARRAVQQNLDQGAPVGALFLDLDNFKRVNDAYGHDSGDRVLKSVATLLVEEVGHTGSIGRYGGEEFVVILQGAAADSVRELGERIVRQIRFLDMQACGASGTLTCSVGAIWCERALMGSAEELIARADQLMYKAKRSGKDRCRFEGLTEPGTADERDRSGNSGPAEHSPAVETGEGKTADTHLRKLQSIATRLNADEVKGFVGIRKQTRQALVLPCVLHYFSGIDVTMRTEPAVTRNLSGGGIGLLVGRPLVRGEPVEVVLGTDRSQLFLAGLVSFCRHIDATVHEIGIQFVVHSVTPIISGNPPDALQKYDWVAQAVTAKQSGGLQPQVAG